MSEPLRDVLPEGLIRLLEREARKRGSVPEAVMAEMLLKLAKPEERPGLLLETAASLLGHASRRAEKGDYGEACRRLWAASLMALEAYAAKSGGEPGSLRDYWVLAERLAEETGIGVEHWYAAIAARLAAEEGACSEKQYREMDRLVRGLVDSVEASLGVAEEVGGGGA